MKIHRSLYINPNNAVSQYSFNMPKICYLFLFQRLIKCPHTTQAYLKSHKLLQIYVSSSSSLIVYHIFLRSLLKCRKPRQPYLWTKSVMVAHLYLLPELMSRTSWKKLFTNWNMNLSCFLSTYYILKFSSSQSFILSTLSMLLHLNSPNSQIMEHLNNILSE